MAVKFVCVALVLAALAGEVPPSIVWLDYERAELTVPQAGVVTLYRRGAQFSVRVEAGVYILPDAVAPPRAGAWWPEPGDQWCTAASCSAPLGERPAKYRIYGPLVAR